VTASTSDLGAVGIVVIGRNEGQRLLACLREALRMGPVAYVDSGSTDGSIAAAEETRAVVIELDSTIPFTAARARNAGWRRLVEEQPQLRYLQFFDGDCIPASGWIKSACTFLETHPTTAAVCGRRRERFPRQSIYNQLFDFEWDGPRGEIEEFGGGVMIRRDALQQVGGYVDSVIAAEDTELSVRLRKSGWRLVRLAEEMEEHDAGMTRLGQWWRRAVRSGHAHAEMAFRHGSAPYRCRTRLTRSCVLYGLAIPVAAVALAWPTQGWSLLLLAIYPLLWLRIIARSSSRMSLSDAIMFATFCLLAKTPEALGAVTFWWNRLRGRQAQIIEYKPITVDPEPLQA
jgi:GT2 family glycosyltransferase